MFACVQRMACSRFACLLCRVPNQKLAHRWATYPFPAAHLCSPVATPGSHPALPLDDPSTSSCAPNQPLPQVRLRSLSIFFFVLCVVCYTFGERRELGGEPATRVGDGCSAGETRCFWLAGSSAHTSVPPAQLSSPMVCHLLMLSLPAVPLPSPACCGCSVVLQSS